MEENKFYNGGGGTTAVACKNTNRQFLGYELERKYFQIAKQRILEANENQIENFDNDINLFSYQEN